MKKSHTAATQSNPPSAAGCAVPRLRRPVTLDARWNKAPWKDIPAQVLAQHMGARPQHFPHTQVKLAYDDSALSVIFRVEDRYVVAVAEKTHDAVCRDSCVEFFFTPGTDVSKGYFNVEINCGGVMLLHFQTIPRQNQRCVDLVDCAQVTIAHSLPSRVDREITDPVTWTVEYRLPVAILGKYMAITPPASGVAWRGNFYKCADKSSHPHWLTWAPVNRPKPDFHVPESFVPLVFE